jgi:hypothetical protein
MENKAFVIQKAGEQKWSDRIQRLKVQRQYIQKYQGTIDTKYN